MHYVIDNTWRRLLLGPRSLVMSGIWLEGCMRLLLWQRGMRASSLLTIVVSLIGFEVDLTLPLDAAQTKLVSA